MYKPVLNRRGIGVNFNGSQAEVRVWAPRAKEVHMMINNVPSVPLQPAGYGYWETSTDLIHPGDIYHFSLDGKTYPDPASLSQPGGVHGGSQVIDLDAFQWTDQRWKNPPLEQYIFYELHTGTFTGEGSLKAVEEKLDHLAELGITAIELMPVAQFPGARNWGYDGVFPFAVQSSYGGADALKHLVDSCHKKNLAVVLDVVYNHLGPEGNYLELYGPYFTDKYKTPWGKAVNFDDAECDAVRNFFIENVLMWFRDFHIDALRFDAIHAVKDLSPVHIMQEIRQYTDAWMQHSGKTHYLIIECDLNDPRFINPPAIGGYGMDAQWCDEFHHALRVSAGEEREGYYSDFNGIAHLAKSYRDAYVYDGQYSAHRHKTFGIPAKGNEGKQFVVFSQNHDQVGNRALGERSTVLFGTEKQKLMAAAVMLGPYLPLLFMGEEWGETNPFLYFIDHSDPSLIAAIRKGRQEEFKHFHTGKQVPDPASPETFLRSKLQWNLLEKKAHQQLFTYYKTLICLRKKIPVLREPDRERLEVTAYEENDLLLLHRWDENEHVLIFLNFSDSAQAVKIPGFKAQWKVLLYSGDPEWGGSSSIPALFAGGDEPEIAAHAVLVCMNCYV